MITVTPSLTPFQFSKYLRMSSYYLTNYPISHPDLWIFLPFHAPRSLVISEILSSIISRILPHICVTFLIVYEFDLWMNLRLMIYLYALCLFFSKVCTFHRLMLVEYPFHDRYGFVLRHRINFKGYLNLHEFLKLVRLIQLLCLQLLLK